ncbi:MAG: adenosylcobinamide-GDP ribazoletransferase [Pseudomonadales bacterium]|nr:adenosylcobinamide-GDP ribazoletransferase [Pseudomonadales bacterium]
MNAFLYALQFLTRLPITVQLSVDKEIERRSFYWHGCVGIVLGACLMLTHSLTQWLFGAAPILNAGIVLFLWVMLTGALHLDGLGDSVDAWLGGYGDKEKTLAIMKDPTSGPAAIVWIVVVLLLKFAALTLLLAHQPMALLFAPLLGRMASMVLFVTTPYARTKGLGSAFKDGLEAQWVWYQTGLCCITLFILFKTSGLITIASCLAIGYYLRSLMLQRIEGTTGDTAGALIECVETVALLGFCIHLI